MVIRRTAIALGSNLGEPRQIIEAALAVLDAQPDIAVQRRSRYYQTAAVGPPQPDYLNACALLETTLPAESLLTRLLAVEQQFGRRRRQRWGPRTLDLDLLLFEDAVIDRPALQVPHPRMGERGFVLVPLAEIAPQWVEPVSGQTVEALLMALGAVEGVQLL
ncbi:MAG: 2-amino-4-hydroxy-6-hydroxymethyldihydropteridine diphosphokinase [Cyanobacteria bacterium P01_A01_bin.135]